MVSAFIKLTFLFQATAGPQGWDLLVNWVVQRVQIRKKENISINSKSVSSTSLFICIQILRMGFLTQQIHKNRNTFNCSNLFCLYFTSRKMHRFSSLILGAEVFQNFVSWIIMQIYTSRGSKSEGKNTA